MDHRTRRGRARLGDRHRPLVLAAALVLALLAAACGGSSGSDGVASATGPNASSKSGESEEKKKDPQQAGLDFARCMREHGVDVPDPEPGEGGLIKIGPGPGGASQAVEQPFDPDFEEADKACRHLLADLIPDGEGPTDPEAQDRALKFAQCMREHGVDMPDPEFRGGAIALKIEGADPQSPTFQEAQKACAEFFGPPGEQGGPAVRAGGKQS